MEMLPVTSCLRYALDPEQTLRGTRFGEGPPVVVWNITNQCNLKCPHCYSSSSMKDTKSVHVSDAFQVIDKLQQAGVKQLIFSGGEPLLHKDLFLILRAATDCGINCHLSTNGTYLNENEAFLLKNHGVVYAGISIDGRDSFNDKHRGNAGATEDAWQGVRNLVKYKVKAGIRTTLLGNNFDEVPYVIHRAIDEGVSRFYVSHLIFGGRARSLKSLLTEPVRNQVDQLFTFAMDHLDSIEFVTGGNDCDGIYLYFFIKKRIGEDAASRFLNLLSKKKGNSAGEKFLNIDVHGDVYPDQFFREAKMGNIFKQSIDEILHSYVADMLKKRELIIHGRCSSCKFFSMCRGSHRERALFFYNDIWASDPGCYLTDEEIQMPISQDQSSKIVV